MGRKARAISGIGVAALLVAGCRGTIDGGATGADAPALTIDSFDETGALLAHRTICCRSR